MNVSEIEALVILSGIPFLGAIKIRFLIHQFGSAREALAQEPALISSLPNFGPRIADNWHYWQKKDSWKQNIELAEKSNTKIIPFFSPDYPKRLLTIPDFPILLYVQGDLTKNKHSIAVVGTRQASIYGKEMAEQISEGLANRGMLVVSGLARGIDTFAHKGALKTGQTIAVIGSGLSDIYPRENINLAHAIAENGALISQFPMNTPPDRTNFPQRNAVVAGMTMGTILVEAPIQSGAMITVQRALEFDRVVFAFPGRVDCSSFSGNHHLIKKRDAALIENAKDVCSFFDDIPSVCRKNTIKNDPLDFFNSEEKDFLLKLPKQELSVDEIVQMTNLPIMKVNVLLMGLLLKKGLTEFPGRIYKRKV